jgi:hypothetical protein
MREDGRFRFGARHLTTGDRVAMLSTPECHGTISFVRSGFAVVRWDHGGRSCEWAAELTLENTERRAA